MHDCANVQQLVREGDVNHIDIDGNTSLHWACTSDCALCVDVILQRGAFIDAKNNTGETALHIAAKKGFEHLVALLLDNGASALLLNDEGVSPLHLACAHRHTVVVRLLVQRCPEAVVFQGNELKAQMAPLHAAVFGGNVECVELLLNSNTDINARYLPRGDTALHFCAYSGNVSLTELLLRRGADTSAVTCDGETPLHYAVAYSRIVRTLLEHDANVINVSTADAVGGYTALHDAVNIANVDSVKFLLQHGADVTVLDVCGRRPLLRAQELQLKAPDGTIRKKIEEIIELLTEAEDKLNEQFSELLAGNEPVSTEDQRTKAPLCCICYTNSVNVVIVTCGHAVCERCSGKVP